MSRTPAVSGLKGERGCLGSAPVRKRARRTARLGEVGELDLNQLTQPGFEAGGMFEGGLDLRLHLFAGAAVEIHDDGVFGRVVIVGGSGGDASLVGDAAHGGGVEAFLAEEFEGGIQNLEASLFGFGGDFGGRHGFERVQ
jgi:hypothetical protein